jgi:putative ABC transport system permease protein
VDGGGHRPEINRRNKMITDLWQDLRYGARMLRKQRGFTLVAVFTLALGIGATTVIFSLVNGYLLRPLPFPNADRLMSVEPDENVPQGFNAVRWQDAEQVFEQSVAWDLDSFNLFGNAQPEAVDGAWVTPGFFAATGVRPALGRAFRIEEATQGGQPVAVISHSLWQRRFGSAPDIVGQTMTVSSTDRPEAAEVVTIIGVLPPDFWFFHRFTEVLVPLRGERMPSMGVLKLGVTPAQAEQHLTSLVGGQVKLAGNWKMRLIPAREAHVSGIRPVLLALLLAVGMVLLIAYGNVVFLLLVRLAGREREFTIREALGASRLRLARQMLLEGLLLALLAGLLGVVIAQNGLALLSQVIETQLGRNVPGGARMLEIDLTVLLAALAASLVIALIFALVPLLTRPHARLTAALNDVGRGMTDSVRRRRVRNALIAVELGAALALLIGAGLLIRSALHLNRLELGFKAENVLKANLSLPLRQYSNGQKQQDFYEQLLERIGQLPGVQTASLNNSPPFRMTRGLALEAEGRPAPTNENAPRAVQQTVSSDYFQVMGIRLLRGRSFTNHDQEGALPVIIVSETLAAKLWPGEDPLGKRLKPTRMMSGQPVWRTVVGVVNDVRKTLTEAHFPDAYIPLRQNPRPFMYLLVRTAGEPLTLLPPLQRAVWELDPNLPVSEVETMDGVVAKAGARSRFLAALLAGFALFAVALAMLGVYGVISYATAQRRHEIAIRMALGAQRRDVIRLFMHQGTAVVLCGVVFGLGGSVLLTRVLAGQIHGIATVDPLTYVGLTLLLAATALPAIFIPARRAAGIDPMAALKSE